MVGKFLEPLAVVLQGGALASHRFRTHHRPQQRLLAPTTSLLWLTACAPPACSSTLWPAGLKRLKRSSGVKVHVVMMGGAARGFELRHKLMLYLREVEKQPDHVTHVVCTDALDVVPTPSSAEEVLAAFEEFHTPLVFSAQPACWVGHWCSAAEMSRLTVDRPEIRNYKQFLNSGQFIGSRVAVQHFLS